jgi:hypothetical protein
MVRSGGPCKPAVLIFSCQRARSIRYRIECWVRLAIQVFSRPGSLGSCTLGSFGSSTLGSFGIRDSRVLLEPRFRLAFPFGRSFPAADLNSLSGPGPQFIVDPEGTAAPTVRERKPFGLSVRLQRIQCDRSANLPGLRREHAHHRRKRGLCGPRRGDRQPVENLILPHESPPQRGIHAARGDCAYCGRRRFVG